MKNNHLVLYFKKRGDMMQYIVKRRTRFGIEKGAFDTLEEALRIKELLEEEGEFVIIEKMEK